MGKPSIFLFLFRLGGSHCKKNNQSINPSKHIHAHHPSKDQQKKTPPHPKPSTTQSNTDTNHRWAAKESIIKAHSPTRQLYMRDILIRTSASTGAPYGIVLDTRLPNTSSPEQIHAEVFASLQASRARSGDYTDPPATDSSATGPEQKSILSETGVLDVEAVEEALKRDEEREVGVEVGRGGDREGRRWEEEEAEVQGQVVRVSISHDGEYAVGMCMAPVMDLVGDVGGEAAARMEGL